MHIESLQVFCDIVETASFSAAAEKNGITQSAVSQQMKAMEERFGAVLVERGKRNFAVTPEGELVLKEAREILDRFRGLESRLEALRDVVAGPLRVATVYSIGFHELPPFLERFRTQYPDVDLTVQYRRANQVYADVLESRADLGLVAYPQNRKGVEVEPVWRDKLVLICPPGHPFAKRQSAPLTAVDGERFISFEPDLPTRKAIDEMFRKAEVSIKEVVEFDNIETVKRGVEIENAMSIVPSESVKAEVEAGALHQIEIDDQNIWRPLGIVRRRAKSITPAMRELIAVLRTRS